MVLTIVPKLKHHCLRDSTIFFNDAKELQGLRKLLKSGGSKIKIWSKSDNNLLILLYFLQKCVCGGVNCPPCPPASEVPELKVRCRKFPCLDPKKSFLERSRRNVQSNIFVSCFLQSSLIQLARSAITEFDHMRKFHPYFHFFIAPFQGYI